MKRKIYQFIFTKVFGWKLKGKVDFNVKKCVLIVVPHTSWYDFFLGIFSRGILETDINYVAKKELFVFPFGYFFKWTGGFPLNRSKNENKVDSIARIFSENEVFRLAIAPEGTRKKVSEWKTGFYYIAKKANVPIIPVAFDYGKKEVVYHEPYFLTDSFEDDLKFLHSKFEGVVGKFPEKSFEV